MAEMFRVYAYDASGRCWQLDAKPLVGEGFAVEIEAAFRAAVDARIESPRVQVLEVTNDEIILELQHGQCTWPPDLVKAGINFGDRLENIARLLGQLAGEAEERPFVSDGGPAAEAAERKGPLRN